MFHANESGNNVLTHLRHGLSSYSPTLRKVGSYVLDQPQQVIYLTITELARESGSSEASVTRLCRTLGCKGFTEFKMALALEVQQTGPDDAPQDSSQYGLMIEESVNALRDTGKMADRQKLLEGARLLHGKRQVQIYGVAASAIVGEYLSYKLLRLGKSAPLFDDMHRAAMNAACLQQDDVVIAISSSGSTKDLLHAVAIARQNKARIVAISNTLRSPLAQLADILLVAAKPEGPLTAGTLHSKVGAMLLVEMLIHEMIACDPLYLQASNSSAKATLPLLL